MAFERVILRTATGQEYGPASMAEVMDWHMQGRVPPDASLVDADTGEVRPVADFPALAIPPPPLVAAPSATMDGQGQITATDRLIPTKNPFALAGFYCGLFGLLASYIPIIGYLAFILAPLALIFGLVGLRDSKRLGVSRVRAWVGIILGGITCLAILAYTIAGSKMSK